ncbi:MAG: hypothetical protein WDZ72_07610 [Cyclobacteriaceae bacterium]
MPFVSPLILQVFDRHYDAGKEVFGELTKKIKSKKSIELEEHLFLFEIFVLLLAKIHFKNKNLIHDTFSEFKRLQKNLKKVRHIRMIENAFHVYFGDLKENFKEYEKNIVSDKKNIYTNVYEIILSIPLQVWEDLYRDLMHLSKEITALALNTASTQIINEEMEYFHFDTKSRLDPPNIHDIFRGLKKVTSIEKIRLSVGLNAVFTHKVHQQMDQLMQTLEGWYNNHIIYQHLAHFLRDRENIDKKYQYVLTAIKNSHKERTKEVENGCALLFTEMLLH